MSTLKNNRPVIVGIFILIGLAILVVTIFTLGGQKKTFVKSITIHAIFKDLGGLLKGGNVWFSGVKIGTVKSISFADDALVEVTMSIEKQVQSHIHKNAFVKIGSDGLIGNKIIIIYGGDSSLPTIEKNDFLAVANSLSTDDMLATLQANNKNLLAITKDFKSISKKIDSGTGTLATLLNDPAMSIKLNSSISNLEATTSNFKEVSASSKSVLSNLKTVSEKLNNKNNMVAVLLNDTAAAASLKATLKNAETSSKKLDEDLEAVQHNFLLRGFFRRKEKALKK